MKLIFRSNLISLISEIMGFILTFNICSFAFIELSPINVYKTNVYFMGVTACIEAAVNVE